MPNNQRFTTLLKSLNLKQIEVATAIGISQSKVSKVESGLQKMTPDIFTYFVEHHNIHPLWLIGKTGYDDKVMFQEDLVPKEELEKERNEKYKVMEELLKYKTQHVEELQKVNS
jgi:transcriptional regulator with XRE-family HTH domain